MEYGIVVPKAFSNFEEQWGSIDVRAMMYSDNKKISEDGFVKITPDNIVRVCQNAGKEFYQSTLELHTPICLVEFKLVPISAIRSKLDRTKNSFINPFVHKVMTNSGEA